MLDVIMLENTLRGSNQLRTVHNKYSNFNSAEIAVKKTAIKKAGEDTTEQTEQVVLIDKFAAEVKVVKMLAMEKAAEEILLEGIVGITKLSKATEMAEVEKATAEKVAEVLGMKKNMSPKKRKRSR